MLAGELGHLIHIDQVVVARNPICDNVVQLAREVQPHAVRKVTAAVEREPEDGVARLEQCVHDRRVGLRTRVRLHVGEFGVEQRLDAIDRQLLDDVDMLAAAVVAPPRVALRVPVGEHRTLGLHDRQRRVIL